MTPLSHQEFLSLSTDLQQLCLTPTIIGSSSIYDPARGSFASVIVNSASMLERVITGRSELESKSCFSDYSALLLNALLDRGFRGQSFRGIAYLSWHHAGLDFATAFLRSVGLCHIRDFGPDCFPVGERFQPKHEDLLVCWDLVCEVALRWKDFDYTQLTSGISLERTIYATKWIAGVTQIPDEHPTVTHPTGGLPVVSRNNSQECEVFFSSVVTDQRIRRAAIELAKRDGRDKLAICREIAGDDKAKSLQTMLNRHIKNGRIRFNSPKPQ